MAVTSLLLEVQIRLVTHKQLVRAIANLQYRGVDLVAVANNDAVEESADISCHGVRWAVAHSDIHHLLLMRVLQTCRHVDAVAGTIGMCQHGGVY